ncbi:MAG: hypothetical protein DRI65_04185 [Chloroflexota bacterium]|nr:MAG: hypothetical protein DRI65_04185 [Chloroflexota bacterium]
MDLITLPPTPSLQLLIAPPAFQREVSLQFIAELAQSGPVRVLDGGNRFDVLGLNRELRRRDLPLYTALDRVQVARAFTCYQMATLLEGRPGGGIPTLVLNLLATFQDENVSLVERLRLLEICLYSLRRKARHTAVLTVIHPQPSEEPFLARVREAADQVWAFEIPPPAAQLTLL